MRLPLLMRTIWSVYCWGSNASNVRPSSFMNPRYVAMTLLVQLFREGKSLSELLPIVHVQIPDATDSAFVRELIIGVIRVFYRLDFILQRLLKKSFKRKDYDIQCVLLLGLYQIIYMRIPEYAAVNEAGILCKRCKKPWASAVVNAVLRNYLRQQQQLDQAISADGVANSYHPQWLLTCLQRDWPEDWQTIVLANNQRSPLTLRVNARKITCRAYLNLLEAADIPAQPVSHADNAIQLQHNVDISKLPHFSEGYVSVQDGAAQLAAGLLQLEPDLRVLDACAAPGGKTAHILESESTLKTLIAVDISATRLQRVTENLLRLGLNASVRVADVRDTNTWWEGPCFDRILLDVPCTGTGVIRRHPDIRILRKLDDIETTLATQQQILLAMWPWLSKGGILLYVTCSILKAENESQMRWFLDSNADAKELPIDAAWGRAEAVGRQILPGENNMDGFYYARLQKA